MAYNNSAKVDIVFQIEAKCFIVYFERASNYILKYYINRLRKSARLQKLRTCLWACEAEVRAKKALSFYKEEPGKT